MNKLFPLQSDHPLFRYFTDQERRHVESIGELRKIAKDDLLIRAHEEDATLFAVEDGRLDIVATREGREALLAAVGAGDVLGEVSFIDDSPRAVSVRAAETSLVRAWDKRTLSEGLAFDPQLLAKFSVALCELLVERMRDSAKRV